MFNVRNAIRAIIARIKAYDQQSVFFGKETGLVAARNANIEQARTRTYPHLFGHKFGQLQAARAAASSVDGV